MQKELLETFSKSLPSSNNLETLAEQLAAQLSGLDPWRWFQGITHSIGSGTINTDNYPGDYTCNKQMPFN